MKRFFGLIVLVFGSLIFLNFIENNSSDVLYPFPQSPTAKTSSTKSSVDTQNNSTNQQTSTPPKVVNGSVSQEIATKKQPKNTIIHHGVYYPNLRYETYLTPNDPSYNQWWIAPNNMTTVWDIPAGAYQTTIAIIDTGFSLSHQEFTNRLAINSGESGATDQEAASDLNCTDQSLALDKSCNNIDDDFDQIVDNESGVAIEQNPSDLNCTDQSLALDKSCNNIDDDGNQLKDDVTGWDFVNFDSSAQAGQINPSGTGTVHGTMVAGVMAASGNNGVGIAGVNWHTKILPIQALDDDSYGDSFTVGQAVYYAADQGVDIISISLGTSIDDSYMRAAINYALDRGVLVVAASGNNGCNCISYPANYPEVIAVGAINSSGTPASFSNYGTNLDILAPGQTITTPTYNSANPTNSYASNVAGTSFATPFVSGLLGLGKMSQPNASWEEIIGAMFENSDRRTNTLTSPHSTTLGFGVVKADAMLARLTIPQSFVQRIQLDDLSLGSQHMYQCDPQQIPATKFYELKKSGQFRYTANLREFAKSISAGWSYRQVGFACMGLPTDNIQAIRLLNLPMEISNSTVKN